MRPGITVTEIFKAAGLQPSEPVPWKGRNALVTENKPGVYVVTIVPHPDEDCGSVDVAYLPTGVVARWVPLQPVIYIGRTERSISRRIKQFYRHVHGNRSPHAGGQDVTLLKCPRWVYWSPTEHAADAEDKMIEYFKAKVRRPPFANRVRSARVRNRN